MVGVAVHLRVRQPEYAGVKLAAGVALLYFGDGCPGHVPMEAVRVQVLVPM